VTCYILQGTKVQLDTLLFELFLVTLLKFALLLYTVAPLLVGSVTFIEAISIIVTVTQVLL